MPIFLRRDEKRACLTVQLAKLDKAAFSDTLARVKSIPGRRFNGETKLWEFPDSADTALRLMTALQPTPDAEVEAMVKAHASEIAGVLLTALPEDADDLKYDKADVLFDYQRAFVRHAVDHPKMILADEMGLGKTVEATAAVKEYYAWKGGENVPILVIAPKAVRGQWAEEVAKWGGFSATIVDGRQPADRLEQIEKRGDVVIINWESFWREPVLPALKKIEWAAIIADEAHRAKNRQAKQSKGLHQLHAPVELALTGTPIMNTPDELWSLLHWHDPKEYSSFWRFHNSYVDEIIAGGFNRRVMVGIKNADALRFELRGRLARRTKKVLGDKLPDKLPTQVIEVELTKAQRKLYEEAEEALFVDIVKFAEENEYDAEELASMPLNKLVAMIPNAGARIAKLRQITAGAKIPVANELIREEPDTPVVAFTWHVDAARQLATLLADGPQGQRVGTIAGTDDADPVKVAFQEGELDHVVCTIAKGGQGLTLTRSSNPLLVEEDWTPAINDQAIDRTHRVGQNEIVTPRLLRCKDTVDDGRVAARNTFKRLVTAQVIGA